MAMLEVKDLEVYYGMIQALKGISFQVNEGEVIALIGANGAGKTTTLHTVSGLLTPKHGSVTFEGTEITKIPAHKIVELGMAHVPEGRRVFPSLSVLQNLKLGAYTRKDKDEIKAYLTKILEGQAFDQKGLIYGMGHAVYSLSDPRERIFKGFVQQLSVAKHREKDMTLYNNIEELAPEIIAQKRKIYKGVSPNVDFYSGFVYDMLGIPVELYTPIFAVARIVGGSAHRLEEIVGNGKIIRPSYKSVMEEL